MAKKKPLATDKVLKELRTFGLAYPGAYTSYRAQAPKKLLHTFEGGGAAPAAKPERKKK